MCRYNTCGTLGSRCIFGFQCPENFIGGDWSLVNAYANGIEDGIGDGRNDRVQWTLPRLFASKGAFKIRNFDEDGFDFRCIKRRGQFVIQQRWDLMPPLAKDLLLHDGLSIAHIRTPLNLAGHQQGIDRLPHVMRQPEFFNHHLARLFIDRYLGHTGRVGIGR